MEWRRALVTNTVDSLRYEVFLFDHGTTCEVDYRCLKKLYKPFAAIPSQTAEAQVAGVAPFDLCQWSEDERSFFKRGVTKCAKNVMLALIINRVEVCTIIDIGTNIIYKTSFLSPAAHSPSTEVDSDQSSESVP